MTPVELSRTVLRAMRRAVDAGELSVAVPEAVRVERPGPGGCGDYATNVALQVARAAGRSPRQVAEVLSPRLAREPGIAGIDITGPGFLNITLAGTRGDALVRDVIGRGSCYGHVHPDTGQLAQLHVPHEVRAVVVADALRRILRSQGVLVRTTCDEAPDPDWVTVLDVRVAAYGRPPEDLRTLRPVPAPEDPLRLGRDAARWALLHPAGHDRPRVGDEHLAQRESNPLFRVRYAHARSRALTRNAADLGFESEATSGHAGGLRDQEAREAQEVLDVLTAYPRALASAARHHAPDRLARHLVTTADALLAFQHTVLPLGDEKPSAAHRARLALAEAAGTVLAGGLSLLGISAPDHL
ncbi:ArgS-related anticodon-binding protein NrtL [Streptomyces formicae]|uniref:arginine--tRNA ligase n=1 Tax=Streptomyces formicae TaxID=1616117 RepID=A0A291QFZ8_9ACTN|nr:DALR anticodon-binding domain-containing protein [Streptomyces formicae]ATL30488.1 Arginyl-tRNA synthetase [Streptomyces formicae]